MTSRREICTSSFLKPTFINRDKFSTRRERRSYKDQQGNKLKNLLPPNTPIGRVMRNTIFGLISFYPMETSIRIEMPLSPNVFLKLIVVTLKQISMKNSVVSSVFTSPEVVALKE